MTDSHAGAAMPQPVQLNDLGWNDALARTFALVAAPDDVAARVTAVHKNRVVLAGAFGERSAASDRHRQDLPVEQRPATGDWVALHVDSQDGSAHVRAVLPRQSVFLRRAVGAKSVAQVVAANVDRVFIVTSLPHDFNLRRLERYVAAAWESGAMPTIVLTKSDLVDDSADWIARARTSAPGVDVLAISTLTGDGIADVEALMSPGMTVALLGSSGVGKSTLINHLAGRNTMRTADVRDDGRGRHTTTHRELIRLASGVLVIDTPGMRELQLWAGHAGLDQAFEDIATLSEQCRFRDCTHVDEPDCAVRGAIETGTLLPDRLTSWRKLQREARRATRDAVETAEQQAKLRTLMRAVRKHTRDKYRGQ